MGLGDPSVTAKLHIRTEKNRTESESGTKSDEPTSYQEWIKQAQVSRNTSWKFNVALHESKDTAIPPHFDKVQKDCLNLFHLFYLTCNFTVCMCIRSDTMKPK